MSCFPFLYICSWIITFMCYLQDQVDNSIPLSVCLKQLARWLSSLSEKFAIVYNSTSANTGQHPCTFATWSGRSKTVLAYFVQLMETSGFLKYINEIKLQICFNVLVNIPECYCLYYSYAYCLLPVLPLNNVLCCCC